MKAMDVVNEATIRKKPDRDSAPNNETPDETTRLIEIRAKGRSDPLQRGLMKHHEPYIRYLVRTFYDLQRIRLGFAGRMEAADSLSPEFPDRAATEEQVLFMGHVLEQIKVVEQRIVLRELNVVIRRHPLWTEYLKGVKGIGLITAGLLISEFNPYRATTPSKFWRFAGQAVDNETGLAERTKRGVKAAFSPRFKSKMFMMAQVLIKHNNDWRTVYHRAKKRYESKPCHKSLQDHIPRKKNIKASKGRVESHVVGLWKLARKCSIEEAKALVKSSGCSPAHVHMKATRYMLKMFLLELWIKWRILLGLDVRPSYYVEKLGGKHQGNNGRPDAGCSEMDQEPGEGAERPVQER